MDTTIELPAVYVSALAQDLPRLDSRRAPCSSQPRLRTRVYLHSPRPLDDCRSPVAIRSQSPTQRKVSAMRLEAAKLWKTRDMSRISKDRTTLMWTRKRLARDEDQLKTSRALAEKKESFSLVGLRVLERKAPRRQHGRPLALRLPDISNWFNSGKDTPEFDPGLFL